MRLHSIALRNFRQHAGTEIAFPAGVVGLLGANESGKSTVLEAVAWALYGAKATRGTTKGLRWHRAPARQVAAVELEFEIAGRRYRIERTERDARLCEDGSREPVAAGIHAVDGHVPKLLGMTLEEWSATYMCRQRDLQRIAAMGGTARRQFFLRVLGVGQIDEALARCRARKRDLKREHGALARGLGSRDALVTELDLAEHELTAGEEAHVAAREAHTRATEALRAAQDALSALRALVEAWTPADRALSAADAEERRVAREHGAAEARLRAEVPPTLTPEGERLASRERRQALADQLERDREERNRRVAAARADERAQRKRAWELEGRLNAINDLGADSPCPTCGRPLGDGAVARDVVGALSRELAEARIRQAEASERREAEAAGPSGRAARAAEELDERIAGYAAEDRARERFYRLVADRDRLSDALARASERRAAAQEARDAIGFDQDEWHGREQALQSAHGREARRRAEVAAADARSYAARGRFERAKGRLAAYDERAGQLRRIAAELARHEGADTLLAEFRAWAAGGIGPELEALASGFVQILTDGRHEGLVLDDDMGARLLEDGLEVEVVSGGTEDITAIAMRLAVSRMIAERAGHPLELLVLDEPFGALDAVRRGNVLELVRRLGDVFSQVVLISHVEETREAVDHPIEITYDEAAGRSVLSDTRLAKDAA